MKIQTVGSMCARIHHTQKGTMMAYMKPYRNDIITPGASTVAEFKTVKTNVRDSMGLKQSVK